MFLNLVCRIPSFLSPQLRFRGDLFEQMREVAYLKQPNGGEFLTFSSRLFRRRIAEGINEELVNANIFGGYDVQSQPTLKEYREISPTVGGSSRLPRKSGVSLLFIL